MQDFDFTKHECSKLAQEEMKGLFVLMLDVDDSIDHSWTCGFRAGCKQFRNCVPQMKV